MPVVSRLRADRKIFIEGEIDSDAACEFLKKVIYLNSEDSEKPIDVLINSPGGKINSGMLMYDVIQSSRAPIRMFCIGRTYSMPLGQEVLFRRGQRPLVTRRYDIQRNELYQAVTEQYERQSARRDRLIQR